MATRTTTNRTTNRKPGSGKPAPRGAAAKDTSADKAKKAAAAAPAAPAAPAPKPVPKETLSLIDEKPKTPRRRTPSELQNKPFTVLPPISRLREPVEAPKPAPAPEAEEPV